MIVGEEHAAKEVSEAASYAELVDGALRGGGGLKGKGCEALEDGGEIGGAWDVEPEGAFERGGGGSTATLMDLRERERERGEVRCCSGDRFVGGRGRCSSCNRRCWWGRRRENCSGYAD